MTAGTGQHGNMRPHRPIQRCLLATTVYATTFFGWQPTAQAMVSLTVSPSRATVVTNGGHGGWEFIPRLTQITLSNGQSRLIAGFYEGTGDGTPPGGNTPTGGRLMYVSSSTEGASWGVPYTLYDSPYNNNGPQITQLSNGQTLHILQLCGSGNPTTGTYLIRASSWGSSWSDPQLIAPGYYCTNAPIYRLPSGPHQGRLVEGLYYED